MQKEMIPECLLPHHFVSSTPHSHAPTPMLLLTPAAPVPSSFPELSDHAGYLRAYCQGLALAFIHVEAPQQVLQTNQPQRKASNGRLPDHHPTARQTHISLLQRLTEHHCANRRVTALQGGGDPAAGQMQVHGALTSSQSRCCTSAQLQAVTDSWRAAGARAFVEKMC